MATGLTGRFIMKHQLAMLASVLVTILCQQHVCGMDVMKSSQWQQSHRRILSNATHVTVRSRVQCAALCLRLATCFRFCHNSLTLTCSHGHGATSSSEQEYEEGTTCFDKIKKKCDDADGFALYTGRCLRLSRDHVTYHEAQDQCAVQGGHLFYYKSLTEDERPLADLMTKQAEIYNQSWVWVGADTIGRNQSFRWNDGTSLPTSSEVWIHSEPNNLHGVEECSCFIYLRLNDISCDTKLQFVCEVDL